MSHAPPQSTKLCHASSRRSGTPGCPPCRDGRRAPACEWLDRSLSSRCDESWRSLLRRYGPRFRYLIQLIAGEHGLRPTRAEVEELSQELYLYWLARGTTFDGRTLHQFWRFVSASVRHLVIDQVRRVTAGKRSPACEPWSRSLSVDDLEAGCAGTAVLPAPQLVPRLAWCRGGSAENRLVLRQEFDLLSRRFAEHCRAVVGDDQAAEVLACAVLDGHSSQELSRALRRAGRPVCESTIDSWVHRLRRHLEEEGLCLPRRPREPASAWPPRLEGVRLSARQQRR